MIDEDRTYENEVRFHNDRLGIKNNRKDYKGNIFFRSQGAHLLDTVVPI